VKASSVSAVTTAAETMLLHDRDFVRPHATEHQ
jgi:hypothetical protein